MLKTGIFGKEWFVKFLSFKAIPFLINNTNSHSNRSSKPDYKLYKAKYK